MLYRVKQPLLRGGFRHRGSLGLHTIRRGHLNLTVFLLGYFYWHNISLRVADETSVHLQTLCV